MFLHAPFLQSRCPLSPLSPLSILCLLTVCAGLCRPQRCGVWEQWMAKGRWEGDTLAINAVMNATCVD
eukprot:3081187-Rhodomonas_salina.1